MRCFDKVSNITFQPCSIVSFSFPVDTFDQFIQETLKNKIKTFIWLHFTYTLLCEFFGETQLAHMHIHNTLFQAIASILIRYTIHSKRYNQSYIQPITMPYTDYNYSSYCAKPIAAVIYMCTLFNLWYIT